MRFALFLLLISINAISQTVPGLKFIQNKGQWNNEIDFQAMVPGGRLGVSANGFSIVLLNMEEIEHRHMATRGGINESSGHATTEPVDGHYFKINLVGSSQDSKPLVDNPLAGYYNYFLGKDTSRWATHALAYTSILYPEVYSGIDFRVSSVGNNLKYDFIVKPGADPSQIKIQYSGVSSIEKSGDELNIRTVAGSLNELKPFSYQLADNDKQPVASAYYLNNDFVSFSLPDGYDECRELIIDPLLIFSTYSGSTADNWGSTATPGEHGTLYSAGVTHQNLGGFFPATVGAFQTSNHGSFDMAIIKYDSAGTRFLHATHLGGSNNDSPESLVTDITSGDLIILGISSSPDFPTGANSFDKSFNNGTTINNSVLNTNDQWDIVLTRLSSNGEQLIGSTFLGGTGNDGLNYPKSSAGPLVVNYGDEMRGDVITDDSGNVFLSSVTSSDDFPIVNGFDNSFNEGITDGVVVKLSPDLSSVIWSSYLGGSGFDAAYSIKFDNDKNLVVAGGTTSTDFPATSNAYQGKLRGVVDGWIARLAANGSSLLNATLTGTDSFDQVYFVDLDAGGNIYCYGQTTGQMPITTGVYRNANSGQFLQKFSPDLSKLQFSTVFGSGSSGGLIRPNISPTAFLVNDCNNIYMAGWGGYVNASHPAGFWNSDTNGMPITNDAYQKTTSGSDFYFIVLNGDATELVYSTYLGGNSSKTHVDGGTSRFDKFGIVYHAVCAGCSFGNETEHSTSDFPTTSNAKSRINGSVNCNNAAFKFDLSSLRAAFQTNSVDLSMPGLTDFCYPDSIVFQNLSTGGKTISWDFGDGTTLTQMHDEGHSPIHHYKQPGKYYVKLKITDLSTCSQSDSVIQVINYFKDNILVGEDAVICDGNSYQLTASGGITYEWSTNNQSFLSSSASPVVQPQSDTRYFVTVTDANSCVRKDTVNISLIDSVHLEWQHRFNGNCTDRPSVSVQNLTTHEEGVTFHFNFGDGTTSEEAELEHVYEQDGTYSLKLIADKEFCSFEEVVQLPVYEPVIPNVFTPDGSPGYNDKFEIVFGSNMIPPDDLGFKVELSVINRWGKKIFESSDYKNDWDAHNLQGGVYYYHVKIGDFISCKNWVQVVK